MGASIKNAGPSAGKKAAGLAIVAALIILGVFACIAIDRSAKERAQLRTAGKLAGRELFLKLLPPADFKPQPYDKLVEIEYDEKRNSVEFVQRFTVEGKFAGLIGSYEQRLFPQGWDVFDPDATRDFSVTYCNAPWILSLQQDANFETDRIPNHRVAVRLTWEGGFTKARCPLPKSLF